MPQILLVEDEPKVQKFICQNLERLEMKVVALDRLDALEDHLRKSSFDLVILDRLLGDKDSLSYIPIVKRSKPGIKILVLSALGDVEDRVTGLELGADDYLPKPFHVSELLARVNTLLRRDAQPQVLRYKDLEIRLEAMEVIRGSTVISLTAKEFRLLSLLTKNPGKVFSRSELLSQVWGMNFDPGTNVVEVTMNRLRSKVDNGFDSPLIHSKRGSGYWFGTQENELV